jgi:hypothetical protein
MRCFIFSAKALPFSSICGTSPLNDLVLQLQRYGITDIYTDSKTICSHVTREEFQKVKHLFLNDWIAALEGALTRQSPLDLRARGIHYGAEVALSLGCDGKPWEHTTVETDHRGIVQRVQVNPSPENAATNICFSGLAWIGGGEFDPDHPADTCGATGFLLPGYWKALNGRENFMLACHDILKGRVKPWPHLLVPSGGRVLFSDLPKSCLVKGILWVGEDCTVEDDCVFENCVIMNGASVGRGAELRNCLVLPGSRVPSGTKRTDKYLTMLGENDG